MLGEDPATLAPSVSKRLLAAGVLVAVSPAGAAFAQSSAPLPPLVVETNKAKKKSAAKATPKQPAPQPSTPAAAPQADALPPLPGQAGPVPAGEYKADYVSSAKFTAPLLDTPQTVTVVPGTIIQERNATNLAEVLRNTPGISFNAGENAFTSGVNNFQLRGFDTSGSIFIDGARDSGSYTRDTFNIEQVEIVKGPAADNGRGTAGGYINIVTKTPQIGNFVSGTASLGFDDYGTDLRKRATVDVNQSSGTVAVRLNGMIEDGGVAGRDIAEANAYGLAPSIAFGLGTNLRAIFAYERLERNDLPDNGVPAHILEGMFRSNPAYFGVGRDTFYGLRSDFDDVQADSVLARFEYDVSDNNTISNQTRWNQTDRLARSTFVMDVQAGNNVRTNTPFYDRDISSITNQTNLTARFATGSFRHTVSTGVEFTHEESDANRQGQLATGPTNIFNPNPDRVGSPPFNATQRNGVEIDTVAGYLFDTIDITRQLQLTGGLRVEHYNVGINSKTAAGAPLAEDGYEDSVTSLGGKIGLVYKPVREGSIYASYGTSGLPPGSFLSNPDISRTDEGAFPGFVPHADPVRMHNYEVGVKWDFFGGKLQTAAALFRAEKDNAVVNGCNVAVSPCPAGQERIAYGEQIVQGIELGVAGNLTDRWKVFGGLLIMDSKRDHSAEFDRIRRNANPGDYPAGVTSTDGDKLAFTPNISATLWTTYDVTDALTLGAGFQYVGESWLGRPDDALRVIPNGAFGKLPDYFLVNLMAAYELTNNVDLVFNVDNVFDETYAVSANWPGQRAILGAPRTYRIGTSFKY